MALFGDIPANTTSVIGAAGQLPGEPSNTSASAGNVGEISTTTGSQSLTTATSATVVNAVLSAGDWDVVGQVTYVYTSATQSGDATASLNTVNNTLAADMTDGWDNTRMTTTSSKKTITLSRKRFLSTSSQTAYLVAQATFSAGTCSAQGYIQARRVR